MNYKKSLRIILAVLLGGILITGCRSSKDVVYLQGANGSEPISNYKDIKIKANDVLSIIVSSEHPEAAAAFNLQTVERQIGASGDRMSSRSTLGYVVDQQGNIDFPQLGRLKVAGMTRSELSSFIKNELFNSGKLKDAVVTVSFQNFKITVTGEVTRPDVYDVATDRVTILEAIAMAGDMTIYGRRDSVMVVRETDGVREIYYDNLLSKDLLNSPTYYLQQNDMVYVRPNNIKAQQSGINQNTSISTWLSIISVLTSIAVLIFK